MTLATIEAPHDFEDSIKALVEIHESGGEMTPDHYSKLDQLAYTVSQMSLQATFEIADQLPSQTRRDTEEHAKVKERCIWHQRNILLVEEVEEMKVHKGLSQNAGIEEVISSWRAELEEMGYGGHQIRERIPSANSAKAQYRIGKFAKWLGFDRLWGYIGPNGLSNTYFYKLLLASEEHGFTYEDWENLLLLAMENGWKPSKLEDHINELKGQSDDAEYILKDAIDETNQLFKHHWEAVTDHLAVEDELTTEEELRRVQSARNDLMTFAEEVFTRFDSRLEEREQMLRKRLNHA